MQCGRRAPAAPCRTWPPRRGPRASGAGRDRRPAAAGGMWRLGGPAAPHAARSAPGSSLAASPCAARASSLRPRQGRAAPRFLCLPALLGSAPAASPCAAMPSASRSGSGCGSGSELAHPRCRLGPRRFSRIYHGIRRGIRAPAVLGRPAVVAAAAGCRAVHACGPGGRDLCPRRDRCWMLAGACGGGGPAAAHPGPPWRRPPDSRARISAGGGGGGPAAAARNAKIPRPRPACMGGAEGTGAGGGGGRPGEGAT